ncbi:hypothetical protein [Arthrobacter sp. STN4]|uniref:hypothetical protein n=1 Tax=Arthrobacter sp. STN4 TaxID=2923276 RepID=UPI00211AA1B9|nr:hypothetical protein [Arthrobacter sp. STN4]MCQ9163803.1 hypothetical protein [Arthrobacter sp. STN4]
MTRDDGDGTGFSITGGAGRVKYTLAEIEAAARGIGPVGEDAQELATALAGELRWMSDFAAQLVASGLQGADATYYAARAAEDFLSSAQERAAAAGQGVAELARHASAAAGRYEAAEAETVARERAKRRQALLAGVQVSAAGIFGPLVFLGQLRQARDAAERGGLRDQAEDMLNDGPAYLTGLLGPMAGLAYLLGHGSFAGRGNSGVEAAAGVRRFFDWSGLAKPGHLELRQVPAGEWHAAPGEGQPGRAAPDPFEPVRVDVGPGAAGLLAGSQDAYGYPPGSVVVDRLDRPDGTRAWIVHLPGTEDWSTVDSANPMDLEGDLEGLTAAQQEHFKQQEVVVQEMMRQALAAAGARATEDVMITGHSGGGIHAAAAAANPQFLADFNVKMIIIAGAPARNLPVAPGVKVLDFQNEDDIVTALDYGPPPDSADWVTVTSHRSGGADVKGAVETVKNAHDLGNYLDDAAALERSSDPGIQAVQGSVGLFLGRAAAGGLAGGGPLTVSRRVYQGRDVDGPKPERRARPG